jgi:hypothetical protein
MDVLEAMVLTGSFGSRTPDRARGAMGTEGLLWRRAFDAVERLVGAGLEELALTRTFNDLLALSWRTQFSTRGLLERQTSAVLHLWNLPTRTDVSRLQRQVGALTANLQELALQLEQDRWHPRPGEAGGGAATIEGGEHHAGRSRA